MNRDDIKHGLAQMGEKLHELETEARKLQNQNLADVIASAKGKVHQLTQHPDLELVGEHEEPQEKLPFDLTAGSPAQAQPFKSCGAQGDASLKASQIAPGNEY